MCRASLLGNKYKELYCSLCECIFIREFSNGHLQEIPLPALVNRRIVNLKETVPRPAQHKQAIIPSTFPGLYKKNGASCAKGNSLCNCASGELQCQLAVILCLIWNIISSGADLKGKGLLSVQFKENKWKKIQKPKNDPILGPRCVPGQVWCSLFENSFYVL